MSRRWRSNRRDVLKAMFAIFGSTGLTVDALANTLPNMHQRRLKKIVDIFDDKDSAEFIGAKYLRRWPGEANIELLMSELLSPVPGCDLRTGEDDFDCLQLITTNRLSDFENANLAEIDGWLLSRTEARLCALVALIGSNY